MKSSSKHHPPLQYSRLIYYSCMHHSTLNLAVHASSMTLDVSGFGKVRKSWYYTTPRQKINYDKFSPPISIKILFNKFLAAWRFSSLSYPEINKASFLDGQTLIIIYKPDGSSFPLVGTKIAKPTFGLRPLSAPGAPIVH